MLLQFPPEQHPGNKLIFNIFRAWAYAWHPGLWAPQPELPRRIYGGRGVTSLHFTPPPPSITLSPSALICKIYSSVRTLPALWGLSVSTFIFAFSAPQGCLSLRNTNAARRAPSCGGHPPAAMSPGAGERRLLPAPGPWAEGTEQRLTVTAGGRLCLPGAARSLLARRLRARSAAGPPGRAQPRAGGGACRRKVLSHGLTRGRCHVRRRARSRRRGTERTRDTERTAHGRTRSAPAPLASSASLPSSRPAWGCCRRARRWAGRRRGGTRSTCGGTASSSSSTSTAPCATATRTCSSGATRWVRALRARPPPPPVAGAGAVRAGPCCPERARPLGRGAGRVGTLRAARRGFVYLAHTRAPAASRCAARLPRCFRGSDTLQQLWVFPPGTSRLPGQPLGRCIPRAAMLGSTRSFSAVCLCALVESEWSVSMLFESKVVPARS